MNKKSAADLGTCLVIYQAIFDNLDVQTKTKLFAKQEERFEKFKPYIEEIDSSLSGEGVEAEIESNYEKFCEMTLDGIFNMLEELFPVENAPE